MSQHAGQAEKDRAWINQCKTVTKRMKGWHISPPGNTDEVHVPRPTSQAQSSRWEGQQHRDGSDATATAAERDATATATTDGDASEDDELTLTHTVEKFTEAWNTNELWSIRIPVNLEGLTGMTAGPQVRTTLFMGFNQTTVFKYNLRGAIGIPRLIQPAEVGG